MMNVTVQAGNLTSLRQALESTCRKIRFGSEFCMYALPSMDMLKEAYESTRNAGKEFVYVTPRLSDGAMDTVTKQLQLLNDFGEGEVVVNDLGAIKVLKELPNLKPHLGRQLVYTPSRCPWKATTEHTVNIFKMKKINEIFYQTSLNYQPTIDFYKKHGVIGADVDWIPEIFPNLSLPVKNGLQVSVNLHSIPAAITRKCHMARFLGEDNLDTCSRPCFTKSYYMKNEALATDLYLNGNTVFRLREPTKKNIALLNQVGVNELVLSLNPLTNASLQTDLNSFIKKLDEK